MKNIFVTMLMVVSLLCTTACATTTPQEDAVNKLKVLTEKLSDNTSKYTDEDWEKIAQEFEAVSKAIEENNDKFTDAQKIEINHLRAQCIGAFTAKAMLKATEAMGIAVQSFGGVMEGFLKGLGKINEEAITTSLTGVMEAMGSAIEQSAGQIEVDLGQMEKSLNQMGDSIEVMGEKLGVTLEAIGKSLDKIGESMEKSVGK
ncbi:MAG: hypothetical protein Q4C30_09015 [Bacteroidia bacterium]|nr:hypothetical protein [Bacteroidia bacterium]